VAIVPVTIPTVATALARLGTISVPLTVETEATRPVRNVLADSAPDTVEVLDTVPVRNVFALSAPEMVEVEVTRPVR
jgi:hypothetical protein